MTDIELGAFLSGPKNPECEALLRMIGGLTSGTDRDQAAGGQAADNTSQEWSDPELIELGNMLIRVRGLSIEEIARL